MALKLFLVLFFSMLTIHAAITSDGTSGQCVHLGSDKFTNTGPFGLVTNEISISFWVEKRAGTANGSVYLGWGRVTAGANNVFDIEDSNGSFCFNYGTPGPVFHTFVTSNTVPQTNVPIHVGFRFASGDSNTAQFWINGERVIARWTLVPSNLKMIPYATEPYRVGSTYAGSTPRCRISDAAIYNTMLNDHEFAALAKSKKRGMALNIRRSPDRLIIYTPLDGEFPYLVVGSGTNMVKDFGPNRFNMTPLSSPRWTYPWLTSP